MLMRKATNIEAIGLTKEDSLLNDVLTNSNVEEAKLVAADEFEQS